VSESANLWSGLLYQIAKHWIAGETYEEAMKRAQQSNASNVLAIINLLGEEITSQEEVAAATAEYVEILKTLATRKIRGCISVKPTQLGLTIEKELYKENMNTILSAAKSLHAFVWMDMEGSRYTADTVDSYLEFLKGFDNVGVAIQAYLKRSKEDVDRILDSKGIVRLVKGAYKESPTIALKHKDQINENFSTLMKLMFERGSRFAIATHDEKLIEEAAELSKTHPADFEFEMLMGIRDAKKLELVQRGFQISEYIPYGKGWWAYSVRRIQEHKSTIFLLARSLISR
jgi:proline dehydrogenase